MRLSPERLQRVCDDALEIPGLHLYLEIIEKVQGNIRRDMEKLLKKQIRVPSEEFTLCDLKDQLEVTQVKIDAILTSLYPDYEPKYPDITLRYRGPTEDETRASGYDRQPEQCEEAGEQDTEGQDGATVRGDA